MFPAKHSDDQTEEHIDHNHDNAWLAVAAGKTFKKHGKKKKKKQVE